MTTMKTIAFFNAKGGVGSTMLAGCSTIFATEACIDVVGASLDPRRDLRRWMDHQDIPWIDAITDVPQSYCRAVFLQSLHTLAIARPSDGRTASRRAKKRASTRS